MTRYCVELEPDQWLRLAYDSPIAAQDAIDQARKLTGNEYLDAKIYEVQQ